MGDRRFASCVTFVIAMSLIMIGYSFIGTTECIVESLDENNCYERDGELHLERYYNLNNTDRRGIVLCGTVINCNTSSCDNDVIVGNNYYCHRWNDYFDSMAISRFKQIETNVLSLSLFSIGATLFVYVFVFVAFPFTILFICNKCRAGHERTDSEKLRL